MLFNPEQERVYVVRDIIPEESPIVECDYLTQLRQASGARAVDLLHVSLLTNNEVGAIAEKYPNDHPEHLLIDALGELQLPAMQYGHISGARVFGNVDNPAASRFYIGSLLDAEGSRRMQQDVSRILGYFGLSRTLERQKGKHYDFHVSFLKMNDDRSYAEYQARGVKDAVGQRQAIATSHPVVSSRRLGEKTVEKQPGRLCHNRLVRRYWPGFEPAAV